MGPVPTTLVLAWELLGYLVRGDAVAAATPNAAAASGSIGSVVRVLNDSVPRASQPCPNDPDPQACFAWCRGISPNGTTWQGWKGGKRCSEVKATDERLDRPFCICFDESHEIAKTMCVSACEASPPTSSAATCSAGDGARGTAAGATDLGRALREGVGSSGRRYLLYDTIYGEGFNLQREVYPRAGWLVGELNKEIRSRCGKKADDAGCAFWTLVLPPWCSVAHWFNTSTLQPWSDFFDSYVLERSKVPVVEFAEYKKLVGGNNVDLALSYMTTNISQVEFAYRAFSYTPEKSHVKNPDPVTSGGFGEFEGWASKRDDCNVPYRPVPTHRVTNKSSGRTWLEYAGKCDGGINAQRFLCAVFRSLLPKATLDMLSTLDESVGSVLLKDYDLMEAPDCSELDAMGLRESMLFSKEIRKRADNFISSQLGGRPYVSAHCRRTDFLRVHETRTPDASNIAKKLNALLEQQGISQVFVATDAPQDLKNDLQDQVKGTVHFFEPPKPFDHPGKQSCAEMWIAARADFFIGTIRSRFTTHIRMERGWLNKPTWTSEQEFCKFFERRKRCVWSQYCRPKRKGMYRGVYM